MRKSKNKPTAPDTLVKLKNTKNKEKVFSDLRTLRKNTCYSQRKDNKLIADFITSITERPWDERITSSYCWGKIIVIWISTYSKEKTKWKHFHTNKKEEFVTHCQLLKEVQEQGMCFRKKEMEPRRNEMEEAVVRSW